MLSATLTPITAAPVVLAGVAPPWIGALDLLIVAGDDPGDPELVTSVATGVYRARGWW